MDLDSIPPEEREAIEAAKPEAEELKTAFNNDKHPYKVNFVKHFHEVKNPSCGSDPENPDDGSDPNQKPEFPTKFLTDGF